MAASDGQIQPASQPPVAHAPQQIAPQPTAFAQLTQISPYVPYSVWTMEALLDYDGKLKEVNIDNNRLLEKQRQREHRLAILVMIGFAAILAVGFWFAYQKIDLGRNIVISAVSAGLGYVAGYGAV